MLYLRNQRKPTYLVCCFDEPGKTFRDELFADYKANRGPMPDDLQLQIPLIRQMLEAMRVPVLMLAGYEADDLIATLARAGAGQGMDVFICSSDKDCRQLLDDKVKIFNLRKQVEFDAASLMADWGVRPEAKLEFRVSAELSRQLKEWYIWQSLRPGSSKEALPLDDPAGDPQRQAAWKALVRQVK